MRARQHTHSARAQIHNAYAHVNTCKHKCILKHNTQVHVQAHSLTHAYTHTCKRTCILKHNTQAHVQAHSPTHTHLQLTDSYANTLIRSNTRIHTREQTLTHPCAHTRTLTNTNTDPYACKRMNSQTPACNHTFTVYDTHALPLQGPPRPPWQCQRRRPAPVLP